MIELWKYYLLLIPILGFLQFSAQDSGASDANEDSNEIESNRKLKAEMISAVHRGDMKGFRRALNNGALREYGGQLNYTQQKDIEKLIDHKVSILEFLLSTGLVVVPSEEFLRNKQYDEKYFEVKFMPEVNILYTPLMLDPTKVKTWNHTNSYSIKPLHAICYLPDVEPRIVKYVLDSGVDINERSVFNMTALDLAVQSKNLALVKFLVEKGANVNNILRYKADEDFKYESDYHQFLKIFSPQDVHVPSGFLRHHSPLISAISEKDIVIFQYLLSVGADVTVGNQSWAALFPPVMHGEVEMVEILLKNNNVANAKNFLGVTALHVAADGGRTHIAKLLLKYGADVNAKDNFGWTSVHVAALNSRNLAMIKVLLDAEDNSIYATTNRGFTPLNLAIAGGNSWFFGCLAAAVARNFTTDVRKHCKETKEYIPDGEYVDAAVLLLGNGSIANHQDDILGWSSLHWAAAVGDMKVARLLVEQNGASISRKSKTGMTPYETAKYFGMTDMSEFLRLSTIIE